jgi:hypothetical protein
MRPGTVSCRLAHRLVKFEHPWSVMMKNAGSMSFRVERALVLAV